MTKRLIGLAALICVSACSAQQTDINDQEGILGTKIKEASGEPYVPTDLNDVFERAKALENLSLFITLNTEIAKSPAGSGEQGRLAGVPIAVKDNIHVAGLPNTAGTQGLSEFVPSENAPVIQRLVDEGALIVGKTNMHELAFGITSNNFAFGAVRNPYNRDRIAGGSSGGSAAAVGARLVPMAIGTDTGGSVRLPSALCGVIGFRPSLNRYPGEGITPVAHTRDVPGPIARSMEDITLLDSVMSGNPQVTKASDLSSIKLGVVRDQFYRDLAPDVSNAMNDALEVLKSQGVSLIEFDMPDLNDLNQQVGFSVALYEGLADMEDYLARYYPQKSFADIASGTSSPDVRGLYVEMAKDANGDGQPDGLIPVDVYEEALNVHRKKLIETYRKYFADHDIDALVFPTTILTAKPVNGTVENVSHNGEQKPTFQTYIQNTDPGSNAGLPGISIPIALSSEGLPIGLELDALPDEDEKLLSIAISVSKLFDPLPAPDLERVNP